MKILCYGDSNTYGFDPRGYFAERYGAENRWPNILAELSGWSVNNQGMNGRAIPKLPVRFPESVDVILIMLGTNDLLQGNSAEKVAQRMEQFLHTLDSVKDKLVVVAPPQLRRGEWVNTNVLIRESATLGENYGTLCQCYGVRFVDATGWEIPMCFDGVHFTEEGNHRFARYLYSALMEVLGK